MAGRSHNALAGAARAVVSRAAGWGSRELEAGREVDLAVSAAVTPDLMAKMSDPARFVRNLRLAWQDFPLLVVDVRGGPATSEMHLRFDTMLRTLAEGMPPLSTANGLRLAGTLDQLSGLRIPFDRPGYQTDAGVHATNSSSGCDQGRLLAALVRFMRAERVVDIGTAYGMSALYLLTELPDGGSVITMEFSEPQLNVSAQLLKDQPQVTRLTGPAHELAGAVNEQMGPVDLVIHDGWHSRDAYVEDFAAYLPIMGPGSVFFLDDIRWEDPTPGAAAANTYAGWQELAQHPRVRRAVELHDGRYGLLQLI